MVTVLVTSYRNTGVLQEGTEETSTGKREGRSGTVGTETKDRNTVDDSYSRHVYTSKIQQYIILITKLKELDPER